MEMIKYSEQESLLYGVNIGRTERIDVLNNSQLLQEVFDAKYDIVKIKLNLEDRKIYSKLNRLPFFYEHYNILTHQKRKLILNEDLEIDPRIQFELYDGSNEKELEAALFKMLINDTVFYDSELSSFIKNDSGYIKNAISYFLSLIHEKNPYVYLFIGKLNDEIAGICSFKRIENKDAEGVIYGIVPKYRDQKLAHSFLNYAIKILSQGDIDYLNTEVLAVTYQSLYPHIKSKFKQVGIFVNLTLYPMLNIENVVSKTNSINLFKSIEDFVNNYLNIKSFLLKSELMEIKGNLYTFYGLNSFDLHYLGGTNEVFFFKITSNIDVTYIKIYLESGFE